MLSGMTESTIAAEVSKNAIRERTAAFMKSWAGVTSEQGERQTFWNEFFAIFGLDRRQVAGFEEIAKRSSTGGHGWIDLLFPRQMAVEHKSAGKNLDEAMDQLVDYLPSLHKSVYPWLLVVSDFGNFQWKNLDNGDEGSFPLADLGKNLHLFWWMAGHGVPHESFADEEAANLKATALLGDLHEGIKATGYDEHALREWMTRILFCVFADDTEVWDRAAFTTWIAKSTKADGSDLGRALADLFQVLDQAPAKRPNNLDEDLAAFTYINGDLFSTQLPIASCDEAIRDALLAACKFDWSAISPAIFGSMFQNVMTGVERRSIGAHYTTEENILRTIEPLFLEDLAEELKAATSLAKLQAFHDKLAGLTFMDPACGCGNFLVIAYREIRRLETETLRRLAAKEVKKGAATSKGHTRGQRIASLDFLCKVQVDQFYGIEIDEWPARIARTAMYLIDHMANREVSAEFGEHYLRFPIPAAPNIVVRNALRLDWNSVLPSQDCDFVFGNPPFVGRKFRTDEQKADHRVAHGNAPGHGVLDYVTGWFVKASEYMHGTACRAAFVATNSITQGQNVSALWPRLFARGVTIEFAHRSFVWTSEAAGKAHVHVVIVGFGRQPWAKKRSLFDYPDPKGQPVRRFVTQLGPYLTESPPVVVESRSKPFATTTPVATYGSTAGDNGQLLFDSATVGVARADAIASKHLRAYMGAEEFLGGGERWVLWLDGVGAGEIKKSKFILDRLAKVRSFREASKRPQTKKAAGSPGRLLESRAATGAYLFVPCVSSERRPYVPMAFFTKDTVPRASSWFIEGADNYIFGILQSSMFMAWLRTVGGRMKSDMQLSPVTVYNPFPFPSPSAAVRKKIVNAAEEVLKARALHPSETLGDLYDPLVMPAKLATAHRNLDAAVDALIAPRQKVKTDADRMAVLIKSYEALASPLTVAAAKPAKAKASKKS